LALAIRLRLRLLCWFRFASFPTPNQWNRISLGVSFTELGQFSAWNNLRSNSVAAQLEAGPILSDSLSQTP
jgi:hypothetical protein